MPVETWSLAMKLIIHKTFLLVCIAFSLVMTANPLSAQVYKTTDADGNVTYTDRPPEDGAEPIKLAPISVIEAPAYETKPKAGEEKGEAANELSLKDMRRNYKDFAIVAPQPEQSLWQPEKAITVAWNVRYQLQPGMKVTVIVNGRPFTTTTERMVPIGELDRGEHVVSAELKDVKNRKIATAKSVTFYVQRPNIYTNRARPAPRG
jgi:hypothetical protein